MTHDRFATYAAAPGDPATSILEIAPDDETDLPEVVSYLNVETPGLVRVTARDGSTGTLFLAAGQVVPLRVARVWRTGTTATGVRGLV